MRWLEGAGLWTLQQGDRLHAVSTLQGKLDGSSSLVYSPRSNHQSFFLAVQVALMLPRR